MVQLDLSMPRQSSGVVGQSHTLSLLRSLRWAIGGAAKASSVQRSDCSSAQVKILLLALTQAVRVLEMITVRTNTGWSAKDKTPKRMPTANLLFSHKFDYNFQLPPEFFWAFEF